jgi:hypothetical protein
MIFCVLALVVFGIFFYSDTDPEMAKLHSNFLTGCLWVAVSSFTIWLFIPKPLNPNEKIELSTDLDESKF